MLDYSFAIIFLIALSPILLLVSVLVAVIDGKPILFKQKRIGQNKKKFIIYKFKTMIDSRGPLLTFDQDKRITKLGQFLRKSKLDELPQLINVVKGEMSFIGPRPEVPIMARERYKIRNRVFDLKPGITGLSSIRFIDEQKYMVRSKQQTIYNIYIRKILPEKIAIDNEYAENISLLLDLKIAIKTIFVLLGTTYK